MCASKQISTEVFRKKQPLTANKTITTLTFRYLPASCMETLEN